jgi:hypothetical protein
LEASPAANGSRFRFQSESHPGFDGAAEMAEIVNHREMAQMAK